MKRLMWDPRRCRSKEQESCLVDRPSRRESCGHRVDRSCRGCAAICLGLLIFIIVMLASITARGGLFWVAMFGSKHRRTVAPRHMCFCHRVFLNEPKARVLTRVIWSWRWAPQGGFFQSSSGTEAEDGLEETSPFWCTWGQVIYLFFLLGVPIPFLGKVLIFFVQLP